jgi:hypothetical protein
MIPKLPLKKEFIEGLSLEELTALQKALYERAMGRKEPSEKEAGQLPDELASRLPKIEPDVFQDVATSLAQIGDMIGALEGDMQKPDLAFADRINLENAHLVLIRRRERLRRDWHRLLAEPYRASN